MSSATVVKLSFREQMLLAREDAIIKTVNHLLAGKGFESMTVDEVAASVGIAKASLYKHFPSKEDLAAAAMVRVMRRAEEFLAGIDPALPPLEKLKIATRWTMEVQLAGEMPALPSQNSSLRATLMASRDFLDCLMRISDKVGSWIKAAQAGGALSPALTPTAILYTLFARACDPVLGFLKAGGQYTDEQIVQLVMTSCFDGLRARA